MADDKPSWKRNEDADDDEDDEEIDETNYRSLKDAVLFAIKVSPSMLRGAEDSPVQAALTCAYKFMQQRIISNPNDMVGILLFGTAKSLFKAEQDPLSRGATPYPNCYLFTDLNVPDADDVKNLKSLVEGDEESADILQASDKQVPMSNLLFCANQIFASRAPNFISRRLFIITDDDDPHANDKSQRSSAVVRAKDLFDLGVLIELFPISPPGHDFDISKFYTDIVYKSSPEDPNAPQTGTVVKQEAASGSGLALFNSLLSSINSKTSPKRALFANLPLEIGPGFNISVKGYIIYKRQVPARSCYVYVGGEKAQLAKGVNSQMIDDSARTVEKKDVRKAFPFGGDQVVFTTDEAAKLRYFGDPGIRIIGFKPMSMLPLWANLRPATFIYPSEEDYVGSTRVFAALYQKLLKDDKMGVVWYIARKNAAPVLAALIAGPERLDEDGTQLVPPGMWLVQLPYADDIRQNPETKLIRAPDSLTNIMRDIVQQLSLPQGTYKPEKYPNPALQWHYRVLQAMALEEDLPEKAEDKTMPKYRQINKRIASLAQQWETELDEQFRSLMGQKGAAGIKREPSSTAKSSLPKRARK